MADAKTILANLVQKFEGFMALYELREAETQMKLETISAKIDLAETLRSQPLIVKKAAAKKADKKKDDTPAADAAPAAAQDLAALVLEDEKAHLQEEDPYPHLRSRWPLARPQKKQSGINRVMYFNRAYDEDPETFSKYITPEVKKEIEAEHKKELEDKKNPEERRLFLRQKYYRYMATHHSDKLISMKNQYNASIVAANKVLAVKETQPLIRILPHNGAANGAAASGAAGTASSGAAASSAKKVLDTDEVISRLEESTVVGDDNESADEYDDDDTM